VAGIVMTVRKILTKSNTNMGFVGFEDETGFCEIIVFPKVWAEKEKMFQAGAALVVEGKISRKDSRNGGETQELKILADTCFPISENTQKPGKKRTTSIKVAVPEDGDRQLLEKIKSALEKHPGEIPVSLSIPTVDGEQEMKLTHRVEANEMLYSQLAYLLGSDRVIFN